jgi:PST family polysaccharide transporter
MFKNVSYSVLLNLLAALTPLVTVPVVLRGLGPEQYGTYAHAAVISNWIIAVFVSSLSNYCIREYVLRSETAKDRQTTFGRLIVLQAVMSAVGAILHVVVVLLLPRGGDNDVYWVFVILTVLSFLNVDWYFYAKGRVALLFWRTLIVRMVAIGMIIISVRNPDDLIIYCIIFAGSTIVANLTGFFMSVRDEKPAFCWRISDELRNARFFFANATLGSVSLYADQFLLGIVGTATDVAYLSICRQMLSATVNFPVAACRSLLAKSTAVVGSAGHRQYIEALFKKYGLGVSIAAILLSVFGSSAVALLAGTKYSISSGVFIICGAAFAVTAANVFVDTQLSVAMKIEKITTAGYAATAVVLLVALFVLLPAYRYTGALMALFIGESVGLIVVLMAHMRHGFFHAVRAC